MNLRFVWVWLNKSVFQGHISSFKVKCEFLLTIILEWTRYRKYYLVHILKINYCFTQDMADYED